uniref:Cytochrome c oxidase assembly protein COX19 n=1 Tax=Fibrocapsa japonica TaxID=94617 RepID=A0A7S2UWU7_9STRA|mmetsp:Transcript_17664/g.25794  ORF Transcript_17664/g.25794 Transcript_17664/m.25794 type:complete len:121 (+) Transcript_17664:162-524(+)
MSAFGGGLKKSQVTPPEKGSFPLDHGGECKEYMKAVLKCLKENNQNHILCRDASKAYLKCRMDRSLMTEESMTSLGFSTSAEEKEPEIKLGSEETLKAQRQKQERGFIAGEDVTSRRKNN